MILENSSLTTLENASEALSETDTAFILEIESAIFQISLGVF